MTRRAAGRSGKVLSLNQYVHRATLGLPKAERLDAAAELRAHLLERITELEQKGFARDEAEFLAVRAMGDPQVTNRQLLGHLLTTPLGWVVLGAVMIGGVSWWGSGLFKPAEIRPSELRPTDFVAISQAPVWPQGWGSTFTRAADLRFPKGTTFVIAAWMTYGDKTMRPSFAFPVMSNESFSGITSDQPIRPAPPLLHNNFRLVTSMTPGTTGKPCPEGKAQWANLIYTTDRYRVPVGMKLTNRDGLAFMDHLGGTLCTNDLHNSAQIEQSPLALNTWAKVYQVWGVPDGKSDEQPVSYAFLLFPSEKAEMPKLRPEQAYEVNETSKQWERKQR
ncbi:permease prefix domain 1-containing protein [Deinococcus detaillensis]|uniref:permease prefix domain 1-containing protein n=1 Tax=Deinococcus detaillensis TaxID=2592048 RepID=UPI00163DD355|nr:permease prefix domain 1-containing protein [Deinococcus detaillensis]